MFPDLSESPTDFPVTPVRNLGVILDTLISTNPLPSNNRPILLIFLIFYLSSPVSLHIVVTTTQAVFSLLDH